MGLEQRLELYSFDNPDQQGFPLSAPERLSWFVGESTRLINRIRKPVQTAIQGFTASALILSGAQDLLPRPAFAQSLPQSTEYTRLVTAENPAINPLTLELSSRVTKEIVKPLADKGIDIDLTGELLTNGWVDDQGNRNILYRNIWFQVGMDGKLTVVNALTELGKSGLDQEYSGMDPIPPKSDQPVSADQLDPNVQSVVFTLSQSLNFNARVTGAKSYGPFNIFRIGDQTGDKLAIMQILEGPQAGQIQLTNIGLQLLYTPYVPKEVVLSSMPFATGGGTPEILPSSEQVIEGPRKILAVYHQPEAPLEVGPTPTFNQLEEHLFSQGVNWLEIKYNNFPELPLPGSGISWMSICPTNTEPTCETPFIYFKRQIDPDKKSVRLELKLAREVPNLSDKDIAYLNQAFNSNVAIFISLMKYGYNMAMIPDARLKLEAETTLLKPLIEISGLQFIFK